MRDLARALVGVAVAAWISLANPAPACAYDRQLGVALGGGYAGVISDADLPHHGFVVGAELGLGLGDTFEVRALGEYALHFGGTSMEPDARLHRGFVGAEVVYLVDVLEWVPFLGLGVGVPFSILSGDDVPDSGVRVDFAPHGTFGLDWLPDREWTVGLEGRIHVLVTSWNDDPLWLTVGLRVQRLFEI